jgi:NADH:ubiquinone oxidoreductase subunit 6 (subunit J)
MVSADSVTKLAQLVLLYLTVSLIYIVMGFPFMGLSYIIVYCGAIAILFLFVIMMISTGDERRMLSSDALVAPLLLFLAYDLSDLLTDDMENLEVVTALPQLAAVPFSSSDLFDFSVMVYTAFPLALVIVAVALLLALVGLIHLVSL